MSAGPGDGGLVVARDHTVSDKPLEGAGVASSWYDLAEGVVKGDDGWGVAAAATGAGLDSLGAVMDPLGALSESVVGFLIEKVSFLHEGLDALAGDPIQIEDQARTWMNVAARLREVAGEIPGAVPAGWDGAAAESYRQAVDGLAQRLTSGADGITGVAGEIATTGAWVGTVRALIRDAIADVVGSWIKAGILALGSAVFTAGGSVATFIAWAVGTAWQLAGRILDTIADLVDWLGTQATRVMAFAGEFTLAADGMRKGSEWLTSAGERLAGGFDPLFDPGATVPPRFPGRIGEWLGEQVLVPGAEAHHPWVASTNGAVLDEQIERPVDLAGVEVEAAKQHESAERVSQGR